MSSRIPNRGLFGQSLASDWHRQGEVRRGTLQQRVIYPADDPLRRDLVIPESRTEPLLSPKAATRWRKRSGASKVPTRCVALLTEGGRRPMRRPPGCAVIARGGATKQSLVRRPRCPAARDCFASLAMTRLRRSMQSGTTTMVAIKSVAHFSIPVSDIGKSTRFYTEVVGSTPRWSAAGI